MGQEFAPFRRSACVRAIRGYARPRRHKAWRLLCWFFFRLHIDQLGEVKFR